MKADERMTLVSANAVKKSKLCIWRVYHKSSEKNKLIKKKTINGKYTQQLLAKESQNSFAKGNQK